MVWVYALMLAFTVVAAVTDLWRQTIYNWLVYPGILIAILSNTFIPGARGWQDSLVGFGACGGIMLCAIVFFSDVGGGDVKLVAMMGAFLGLSKGFEAMLWTFVLGAVIGVGLLIWRVGAAEIVKRIVRHVSLVGRYRQILPLDQKERAELKAPLKLAPAALLAELIVVFELVRW